MFIDKSDSISFLWSLTLSSQYDTRLSAFSFRQDVKESHIECVSPSLYSWQNKTGTHVLVVETEYTIVYRMFSERWIARSVLLSIESPTWFRSSIYLVLKVMDAHATPLSNAMPGKNFFFGFSTAWPCLAMKNLYLHALNYYKSECQCCKKHIKIYPQKIRDWLSAHTSTFGNGKKSSN